jgi:hypothetical protein
LLFLRCLLAGAKVVHTPETLVLYRLGEEGKLTESKEGHVRRVTHWARFLVKASQEVGFHAEARLGRRFNLRWLGYTRMGRSGAALGQSKL